MAGQGEQTIRVLDRQSTKRIVNRFLAMGWWYTYRPDHKRGVDLLTFSNAIDLTDDLRRRLPDLRFEVAL